MHFMLLLAWASFITAFLFLLSLLASYKDKENKYYFPAVGGWFLVLLSDLVYLLKFYR